MSNEHESLGYRSGGPMPWANPGGTSSIPKGMDAPIQRAEATIRPDAAEILHRHANAGRPIHKQPPTQPALDDAPMAAAADAHEANQDMAADTEGQPPDVERCIGGPKSEGPDEMPVQPTDDSPQKCADADEDQQNQQELEGHSPITQPTVSKSLAIAKVIRAKLKSGGIDSSLASLIPKGIRGGNEGRLYLTQLASKLEKASQSGGVVDPSREMGMEPGGRNAPGFDNNQSAAVEENPPVVRGEGPPDSSTQGRSMLSPALQKHDASRMATQGKPPSSGIVNWGRSGGNGLGGRGSKK